MSSPIANNAMTRRMPRRDRAMLSELPAADCNPDALPPVATVTTIPPTMTRVQKHLRNTFLAGIFAAIPVGATIFIVWYVEHATRAPLRSVANGKFDIPFIGIPIAIGVVYLLGLGVSSIVGRWALRTIDRVLLRLPLLKEWYTAWKQVAVTPGGKEGMYAKVVLVPLEGEARVMGFTSGEGLPGDDNTVCVFVPNSPNPVMGRLYFVARDRVQTLTISAEEAFKFLLSGANYIPPEVGAATSTLRGAAA
jgi:uncharacterized membrane protein